MKGFYLEKKPTSLLVSFEKSVFTLQIGDGFEQFVMDLSANKA